jgi:tetratricopeptide (TPR) repeat protein
VRLLRVLLVAGVLAASVAPEMPRYAAERRMGYATAAFRGLLERTRDSGTAASVLGIGQVALSTTADLPGDPRPWIIAGSAFLVSGQPERALENYREAFATGERAEIDLNLGRAYALAKRRESAEAALLRAGWVSPEILATLPAAVKDPLLFRIGELSQGLREGRLAEPPPLPEEERR